MANNETTTKFRVDISDISKAMQEAKRYVAVANSEFKKNASAMDDWRKSSEGLEAKLTQLDSVLDGQKRQLEILENQYNNLTDEQKEGSKAADDLIIKINNQKAAINKTEKEIDKFDNELKDLKAGASAAGNELNELGDSARGAGDDAEDGSDGFTILKGALADLVADGIKAAVEALQELATDGSAAYAQFQAATGKTAGEMGKWKDVIQQIYNDNFGGSLDEVAEKITRVNEVLGDLSPDEMVKVTEAAMTLEDTFGMDMTETLRGVQSLMTHFGMTSEEALNYISAGAQNGLNYTDELGDNLSEYAGKFAEAGYSAEEYFQLLQNGSDGGAYNLDKVNDAINEVTARLADGTIEGSLDMFSTGTQDVFKAWQDGDATQKEVIDSIVKDIQGTTNEQEKMNLAAKAFGTMGEDGGTKFIESLSSVGDTYDDVTGKAEKLKDVKYSDIGSALSSLGRTLKSEILQPIVDKITPAVSELVEWLTNNMSTVAPVVAGIATAFGVLASALAIQSLINGVAKAFQFLNLTMLGNPIVLIVAGVAAMVTAIVMLWKKNEEFRNFILGVFDAVKGAFDTVVTTVKTGIDKVKSFFTTIISFITDNWQSLLTMLINPFAGLFTYFYNNNKAFKEFVDNAVAQIKQLPSKMWNYLKNAISNVTKFASQLASKGKKAGSKLLSSVVNGVKSLPGKIKSIGGDVVAGLWNGIGNKVNWLKSKIKSFVGNVKDWLKKFFKIGSPSRLMADEIGQWIPAGIGVGIEENTKSLYSSLKGIGNAVTGGLNTGLTATASAGVGGVVNNFNQVINSPKPLTRLEIYRQSKNLLGYVGGR